MPHLAVPRKGWENEHLATILLSRIAFVAHPVTVADDIGSDFFCTLFETKRQNGKDYLFPRNSFAIQVKSSAGRVDASNKIDYLDSLEIPFFLGVVNRSPPSLAIYSGEFLPIMFSRLGSPGKLTLDPVGPDEFEASAPYDGQTRGTCTLRLPFVVELAAGDDSEALSSKGKLVGELCSRVQGNIAARSSHEYIFMLDSSGNAVVFAGCTSARTFRRSFHLRLAEVFRNLQWLLEMQPVDFIAQEFEMYERIYVEMKGRGTSLPGILCDAYEDLKERIANASGKPAQQLRPPAGAKSWPLSRPRGMPGDEGE